MDVEERRGRAEPGATPEGRTIEEARCYLAANAAAVDPVLKEFWSVKRAEWSRFGDIVVGGADAYDALTSDGKKIRAGLVRLGYDACHGDHSPASFVADGLQRAAGCVEVLHNAFLIHDDIVDNSDLRRNRPTVHRRYADACAERFRTPADALAYGNAVALNFGDKGQALAQELLLSSGFPEEVLLKAVTLLSQVTIETVTGQLLDVGDIRLAELDEQQVLLIHEFKTAHYTIMLPLLMGAILAGAPEAALAAIRGYAVPIGIAFQIQDDILGLFGEEDLLGKPVDSDLKEGKKTLLFVHAHAAAASGDRRLLERAHGDPGSTPADLEDVRRIVRETGALARSEGIARLFVAQGKLHIPAITASEHWRRILGGLADYFIQRRY